jgi:hypothetical protein
MIDHPKYDDKSPTPGTPTSHGCSINQKKESVKISWMQNLYVKLREGRERLVMDIAKDLGH